MREREPLEGGTYVQDRFDVIWRVVRDGGMVTTADDMGIISGGIQWLQDQRGPLRPLGRGGDAINRWESLDVHPGFFAQEIEAYAPRTYAHIRAQALREAAANLDAQAVREKDPDAQR